MPLCSNAGVWSLTPLRRQSPSNSGQSGGEISQALFENRARPCASWTDSGFAVEANASVSKLCRFGLRCACRDGASRHFYELPERLFYRGFHPKPGSWKRGDSNHQAKCYPASEEERQSFICWRERKTNFAAVSSAPSPASQKLGILAWLSVRFVRQSRRLLLDVLDYGRSVVPQKHRRDLADHSGFATVEGLRVSRRAMRLHAPAGLCV